MVAMDDSGSGQRRIHPRHEVDIRVDWFTGQMFVSARVGNLSEGGLFLRADQPMPADDDVSLILMLPGGRPVRAKGRVAWTRAAGVAPDHGPGGCGVQFVEMHVADRAMLQGYLRELAAGTPPARGH
jgi:uncharacterized protein (TIGR02266 family)